MKKTRFERKLHLISDFIIVMLPFIFFCLNFFRNGDFNLATFENDFLSGFRNFDFGLSNYIITNIFNGACPVLLLFLIDLMIYLLWATFFELVYKLLRFFIEIIEKLAQKWGGLDD